MNKLKTETLLPPFGDVVEQTGIRDEHASQYLEECFRHAEKTYADIFNSLRKQRYDFRTIFECVTEVSARSLDVNRMLKYVMRTMMGQFGIYKVLVLRRNFNEESRALETVANIGIHPDVSSATIPVADFESLLLKNEVYSIEELSKILEDEKFSQWKNEFETLVPLINHDGSDEKEIEGVIFLGKRLSGEVLKEMDRDFLTLLSNVIAISFRNESLYRKSIIDDLTRVHSRGRLDAQLIQEVSRVDRYDIRGIAFMMVDIDYFKKFNDTYGHQIGDLVLKELARVLKEQVRCVDSVARYGGEEFAIILLEIEREESIKVAERIHRAVEEMAIQSPDGDKLSVTISMGLACYPRDADSRKDLVKKADQALYRAKENGRNRLEVA